MTILNNRNIDTYFEEHLYPLNGDAEKLLFLLGSLMDYIEKKEMNNYDTSNGVADSIMKKEFQRAIKQSDIMGLHVRINSFLIRYDLPEVIQFICEESFNSRMVLTLQEKWRYTTNQIGYFLVAGASLGRAYMAYLTDNKVESIPSKNIDSFFEKEFHPSHHNNTVMKQLFLIGVMMSYIERKEYKIIFDNGKSDGSTLFIQQELGQSIKQSDIMGVMFRTAKKLYEVGMTPEIQKIFYEAFDDRMIRILQEQWKYSIDEIGYYILMGSSLGKKYVTYLKEETEA